jgi:aminopeptidase N
VLVRRTVSRSIAVARVILYIIVVALVAVTVATSFAQPPKEDETRDIAPQLARAKADRFARAASMMAPPATPNQLDYDVTYYDIDIEILPLSETVGGTVTMKAAVVALSITTVELDLENTGMTVSEARSAGSVVGFSHAGDIVAVTLERAYAMGEIFTVEVDYSGTPDPSYDAFGFDTHDSSDMIWSLSEPFGARSWWPCKDHPEDKADSVDVRVTIPDNLIVASNGTLVSETALIGNRKQYHWHEQYPIATYLVSVAIHPYTVWNDWYKYSPTDSTEIQFYVFSDRFASSQTNYLKTKDMMAAFAGYYGEYPFIEEKYGHADFLWGGAMEHQTCTSMGGWSESLIAHELAHQWWGDYVTCDDFHHIWMNEGFATYSEALWQESEYGMGAYWAEVLAARYLGSGTIYVPDTSDWYRIFHTGLSYNKGSWVLHMLRHVVGDTTFFDILQAYYNDPARAYGTVTTEQFRDICEAVWGGDLDWFFHQWIYEEYFPSYSYAWSTVGPDPLWHIILDIDQLQTNHIFTMPIDVKIDFAAGDTTLVVWDSLATQSFTLTVDQWILRSVVEQVTDPTFHRGILLVNGVNFDTYGAEIQNAYIDSTFTGCYPFTFWDCFSSAPSGGYPAELPAPIGTGPIPAGTLKEFSTVVWVGNNYLGDIDSWYGSPIMSFIEQGGNVLLMSRMGVDFISGSLQDYLGINWVESSYNTIGNCVAMYGGLSSMLFSGTQSSVSVFATAFTQPESELLFTEMASFPQPRGLGVWRRPAGGGVHRADGAQFAFISGRPYRYDRATLEANVEYLLEHLFEEPKVPTAAGDSAMRPVFALQQNYPNPFNPHTTIRFTLASKGRASLRVYDVVGRLVKTIVAHDLKAGPYAFDWDGTDDGGARVASGVYFYRLKTDARSATRKMVLLR